MCDIYARERAVGRIRIRKLDPTLQKSIKSNIITNLEKIHGNNYAYF